MFLVFVKHRRKTALLFLLIFFIHLVAPLQALAITSGPAQPEMQGFQSIGSNDMVDLFSGDFKYNIPLMDVGGYPLNISYNAGSSMDDDASWVGNGWSLTPGVVNRQMKALPDDFKGDGVDKIINLKDKKRVSVSGDFKPDFLGSEKILKKLVKVGATFKATVYKDNYYGWGAAVGVNAGLELSKEGAGTLTTGLGLNSDTREGVGVSPSVNLSYAASKNMKEDKIGVNLGFDYNSRQGMQSTNLGLSYTPARANKTEADDKNRVIKGNGIVGSYINNAAMTYTPTVDIPRKNELFSVSLHLGGEFTGLKAEWGLEGSYSIETIPKHLRKRKVPAYGFLYAHEPIVDDYSTSLVDMNREKDIPYFKGTPLLPIPVLTNDNFVVTSQNGSGQFKLYRSGSGIGHDPYLRTEGGNTSMGVDIGAGLFANFGIHGYVNRLVTTSNKWIDKTANRYQAAGDYKAPYIANPIQQNAVFKKVGEMTQSDEAYYNGLGKAAPVKINIGGGTATSGAAALKSLSDDQANYSFSSIEASKREKRTSNFSYLTAKEASLYGLDKTIKSFAPVIEHPGITCNILKQPTSISRTSDYRLKHHISEISVLDNKGTQMVYGIPVYNTNTTEVTFAVNNTDDNVRRSGIIQYTTPDNSVDNLKGRDNYFSKDIIPAYATSYLLTGILSPDYRDITNDGITDDDYGTAVKFNYSKLSTEYHWRSPYSKDGNQANYNDGLAADRWDNKANYTYGKKEVWYMHSIESKNFVAIFYTSEREDGLGVAGENGVKSPTTRLRKLDSIALFSKPDFMTNDHPKPIKVAHFRYDYSTGYNAFTGTGYPNFQLLNNSTTQQSGKLTLTKVFFTYGKNQKGKTTPYQFFYKKTINNAAAAAYKERQADRWGTYKDEAYNPSEGNNLKFTNAEFPYTNQGSISNEFAGVWNLDHIKLPSGGEIKIEYESDDYAYVQNKRAALMLQVYGVGKDGVNTGSAGFIDANEVYVVSPVFYNNAQDLVKDMTYLYGKFYLKLKSAGNNNVLDYVPSYAEIDKSVNAVTSMGAVTGGFGYRIRIKKVVAEGLTPAINPFSLAAWQYLRNNLPHHAYPGFENNTSGDGNLGTSGAIAAVRAVGNAIVQFKELFENYNHKFYRLKYANSLAQPEKCWVRLTDPTGMKKGGGHRVRKVTILDNWGKMANRTENDHYENNGYGQVYEYTKQEGVKTISSGVASYEPGIGSDENPFKIPVFYSKKITWGLDYNTYLEEPIGESYMPAPSVGYSQVIVRSFGAKGYNAQNNLGYTQNDFYTAKDFPLLVSKTGPAALSYNPKLILSLVTNITNSNMTTTQGVTIIQNDMHGKQKAVKTFDKGGSLLSSSEYEYKVQDPYAENNILNNEVDLLKPDGNVGKGIIGQDVEFYSDMRYQRTTNIGFRAGVYFGATLLGLFWPTGFGGVNIGVNSSDATFNSASVVKIVSRYGILQKITKMENGSSASTENLLWDPETGEVLLTKTNNEFDQPVFNLTYPAHWGYKGMGPAYQNAETIITDISTLGGAQAGKLAGDPMKLAMLQEGDELIDVTSINDIENSLVSRTYWVVSDVSTLSSSKYLLTGDGQLASDMSGRVFKIHRSGYRNLANEVIASIVSLNNPVVNGKIDVSMATKVLDAKAVLYKDEWPIPVNFQPVYYGNTIASSCIGTTPVDLNPYYQGLKGQWRPWRSYVYQTARKNTTGNSFGSTTSVLNAGTYSDFDAFYNFENNSFKIPFPGLINVTKWIWSQQSKFYSLQGEELESEDALNRFTAARFGHKGQLPVAVGKNARALELHYDGFEDHSTSSICTTPQCLSDSVFLPEGNNIVISTQEAHTGNYSLSVAAGKGVTFNASTSDYTNLDNMLSKATNSSYFINHNDLARTFMPKIQAPYILSFWIKDNQPTSYKSNVLVNINNEVYNLSSSLNKKWPIVEGWKRIELPFSTISNNLKIVIESQSSAAIYIDDIRIFPSNGQMKSFAYDAVTQRLMAELDENNFATFYEYDDEGTLIRVKKETERGIKTIKESRQYIRPSLQ